MKPTKMRIEFRLTKAKLVEALMHDLKSVAMALDQIPKEWYDQQLMLGQLRANRVRWLGGGRNRVLGVVRTALHCWGYRAAYESESEDVDEFPAIPTDFDIEDGEEIETPARRRDYNLYVAYGEQAMRYLVGQMIAKLFDYLPEE